MWRSTSILIGIVLILLTLGVVMLASTSSVLAETRYGDPHYFVKHQVLWLALGLLVSMAAASLDYHHWRHLAVPLAIFSAILLLMAVLPGVGLTIKGSHRWLRFGSISFQPSELAKFSAVVLLAWWMALIQRRADEFRRGMLVPLLGLGVLVGLIFIEPDFGTTMLVGAVGMMIMFTGGTRVGYLLVAAFAGLSGFILAIMQNPERMRRIIAFTDPEKHARTDAYQLLNAIYAFVVGGGKGVGLGQSLQKHFYLPEAHTDFIFAIIGEEFGLAASIGVVLLYAGFFLCGIRISFRAPDKFGQLLGFGLTSMITLQALINIGVVTGSLPTKGLPLPFISFGGSSMVISLLMVGVLVNIALHGAGVVSHESSKPIKDRAHRL